MWNILRCIEAGLSSYSLELMSWLLDLPVSEVMRLVYADEPGVMAWKKAALSHCLGLGVFMIWRICLIVC